MTVTARFGPCSIEFAEARLTLANELLSRTFLATDAGLAALSLQHGNTAWLRDAALTASPAADWTFESWEAPLKPGGATALWCRLTREALSCRCAILPGVPAVYHEWSGGAEDIAADAPDGEPSGIETGSTTRQALDGAVEILAVAPLHLRLIEYRMQDQTDNKDNLCIAIPYTANAIEAIRLSGCLFALEDVLTGAGLVYLKEAPLPQVRPRPRACDVVWNRGDWLFLDADYPWVVLAYQGGAPGRTAALHQYQRARRPLPLVAISNTWGDRNRDGALNEEFLLGEIDCAARLGLDVCQIDDGWQRGITSNSVHRDQGGVWEGFYASDPDFWLPHPQRLPNGLDPLVARARERGVELGLWFAPDSFEDFAHWRRDAQTILSFWRGHGIRTLKIDGVKSRTREGEANLHRFFNTVLAESGGAVAFDLDVTAEVRPGYWGLPHTGPIFVENRYTDWHKYWPHLTLKNLWSLSRVVHPARLRMELLNHARHSEQYAGDPLAPERYSPAYLFASVMVSAPLFWCELQHLPEAYFADLPPLIATWRAHRQELAEAVVIPVGDEPSGAAVTGFRVESATATHLILFREWTEEARLFLSDLPGAGWTRLAGAGDLAAHGGGVIASLPERLGFGWWRCARDPL